MEIVEVLSRDSGSRENDPLYRNFVRALDGSLAGQAEKIGVDTSRWRFEALASNGHVCPLTGFQSRHAALIPVGANSRNSCELYCILDWACNGWCRVGSETDSELYIVTCREVLEESSDPPGRCEFRAFVSTLQGGFGLPPIRPAMPPH